MIAAFFTSKRLVTFLIALCFTCRLLAQSGEHLTDNWITDGSISRLEHSNGYTMLSGYFEKVGPYMGSGVATDPATGQIDTAMPKVHGQVDQVVPDGHGGWYLLGSFGAIDTVRVNGLAHIKADKTVDRTWKPVIDGYVATLAVSGDTLYAGGHFASINGQNRTNLASFKITTGALINWDPAPNNDVNTITVAGAMVYVGGDFTAIGGVNRGHLAAVSASTGVASAWAPVLAGPAGYISVDAIKVDDARKFAYVGGYFITVNGVARMGLAQFNLQTGGTLTGWNANLELTNGYASVDNLELTTNVLFIQGYFSSVGAAARDFLAAVDVGKASVLPWNPTVDRTIQSFSLLGNTLYLVGYFTSVDGLERNGAAALDVSDINTVSVTDWTVAPSVNSAISIAATPSSVFVGGFMTGFDWIDRSGFALLSDATHEAWPFPVNLSGGGNINTIAVKDNVLYIGGRFSLIGRSARHNLAAFDLTTGELLPWNPTVDGAGVDDAEVFNIRIKDNLLYIAGRFMSVNNANTIRFGLAAVDLATGTVNAWNPAVGDLKTVDQYVNSIDIVGNTVYAGGYFNVVGGNNERGNLAAIDATTGSVLPWAPISNGEVTKIRVAPNAAYVVGYFDDVGGEARNHGIAALDLSAGTTLPWDTLFGGTVADIALSATDLYVSGYFDYVGASQTFRPGLCSFSLATGELNDWLPDNGGGGEGGFSVQALSISPTKLYVGGYIYSFGLENRENYGEYAICPAAPVINASQDGTALSIATPLAGSTIQWYRNDEAISNATDTTLPINMYENATYAVDVSFNDCVGRSKDYVYLITSTEQPSFAALYPNPVRDELNVHLKEIAPSVTFTINDITGRPMKVVQSSGQDHVLSLRELPTGPYVLMINTGAQKHAHKLIKVN